MIPPFAPIRRLVKRAGLLPAARAVKRRLELLINPQVRRRDRADRQAFVAFQRAYGCALAHELGGNGSKPVALVVSIGFADGVKQELGLIKGLQLGGFEPVVLTWRDPWLASYYRLAGVRRLQYWDEFLDPADGRDAAASLDQVHAFDELLALRDGPIRIGRFAAATAFRWLRAGSLNVQSPEDRRRLAPFLADALAYARAAERIVRAIQPRLAVFVDKGYTPQGQLFDQCVAQDIDAITWHNAHNSRSVILKRYTRDTRDAHPASLSSSSWEAVRRMAWTEAHRQRLQRELSDNYVSGEWFSEVGTQRNKRILEPAELQRRLGLDGDKKTAVIFPHILWDGTFFWGTDLFRDYEAWLLATVQAACANDRVNWIIKFHPANMVKNARDGVQGEPAELLTLRRHIGPLPPHLATIPAESDINTYSLFRAMDYCVTVRGTIGVEAASFGIPVLTAGTGRYDHKGFTVDSESPQEYVERIRRIHEIPLLSAPQRELAERFAYGVFVLRPLPLTAFTAQYQHDAKATCVVRIHARTKEDWLSARDMNALAKWASASRDEDVLLPDPLQQDTAARTEAAAHEAIRAHDMIVRS